MMTWEGKKVLVTGGAGFIGSELVRQLAEQGARVTVVDSLVNGRRENLGGLFERGVVLAVGDIRDADRMEGLLARVDLVFHLACLGVRHSIHSPSENHEVNAAGTLKLLTISRAKKVPRFVYVSSSEVYGSARHVPMKEDHPTSPRTVYGASKLAGECYARAFYEAYGYPTVVVRPFNTYGPCCHHEGDSGEVIPKFLLRALAGRPLVVFGDGKQTRDFTFVSDIARGILAAGACDEAVGKTLNLGSGRELKIKELAEKVRWIAGRPQALIRHEDTRPGDVRRLCADVSLARKLLGFESKVTLEEGLNHLLRWYRGLDKSAEILLEEEVLRNWERPTVVST